MDVDRAARIQAIKQHPGWEELVADVEEKRAKFEARTIAKMMSDGEPYDKFEYERGFWAGLRAVTRYPDRATGIVEKHAARQKEEEQSE